MRLEAVEEKIEGLKVKKVQKIKKSGSDLKKCKRSGLARDILSHARLADQTSRKITLSSTASRGRRKKSVVRAANLRITT